MTNIKTYKIIRPRRIFQTSMYFFHNDHEDKSKNQQTRNGTITKSVGCFVNHVEGSFFFFIWEGKDWAIIVIIIIIIVIFM